MKQYAEPIIEVVSFAVEDVVTTSADGSGIVEPTSVGGIGGDFELERD